MSFRPCLPALSGFDTVVGNIVRGSMLISDSLCRMPEDVNVSMVIIDKPMVGVSYLVL